MNVYRLDYWYEERTHFEWFRSKRAAEKRCAEIRRMYSDKDLEVEKITIPSGKQGLIDWLNMYLASCPGTGERSDIGRLNAPWRYL